MTWGQLVLMLAVGLPLAFALGFLAGQWWWFGW